LVGGRGIALVGGRGIAFVRGAVGGAWALRVVPTITTNIAIRTSVLVFMQWVGATRIPLRYRHVLLHDCMGTTVRERIVPRHLRRRTDTVVVIKRCRRVLCPRARFAWTFALRQTVRCTLHCFPACHLLPSCFLKTISLVRSTLRIRPDRRRAWGRDEVHCSSRPGTELLFP